MVKSKNIIVKAIGIVVVSGLILLLIISLAGGLSNTGASDPSTIAVVNGQKVSIYDFNHFLYTDQRFYGRVDEIKADTQFLNYVRSIYLQRVLSIQYAKKLGVLVVDEQVKKYIRSLTNLSGENGKFSKEKLDQFLSYYNISYSQFFRRTKNVLVLRELDNLIFNGTGLAPDEIRMEKAVNSSKITLEYAFLSNAELRKRYKERLVVSDNELNIEIKRLQDEVSEVEEDLDKLKSQARISLESKKLAEVKGELVMQVNKLAEAGKVFSEGVSLLELTSMTTKPFQIGSPVYSVDDEVGLLMDLYIDNIFFEDCLKVKDGVLARTVDTSTGLYIFSPKEKVIVLDTKSEVTRADSYKAYQSRSVFIEQSLLSPFFEKSRIVRNFK